MKIKTNPFTTKQVGNTIEVWIGEPNNFESEFVLCVDKSLLPALIATLNQSKK